MIRAIKRLFHRPAIRLGSLGTRRESGARLRNERFASYLASNNRKVINTDLQDAMLAGRKFARRVAILGALVFAAWIVLESARAVGMF